MHRKETQRRQSIVDRDHYHTVLRTQRAAVVRVGTSHQQGRLMVRVRVRVEA